MSDPAAWTHRTPVQSPVRASELRPHFGTVNDAVTNILMHLSCSVGESSLDPRAQGLFIQQILLEHLCTLLITGNTACSKHSWLTTHSSWDASQAAGPPTLLHLACHEEEGPSSPSP